MHTQQKQRPVVWTIAGSDSGAGAGIQADLRAFNLFGVHGCTAIAAITAQNSLAVESIEAVSSQTLDAQLAALAKDMPPVAVKTGMLATAQNVVVVAKWIDTLRECRPDQPVALIVDPIRRASTGAEFASDALRLAIIEYLIPRATFIKPNRAEAYWLVHGKDAPKEIPDSLMPELAQHLRSLGAQAVLITGGDVGENSGANITKENTNGSGESTLWADDWMDTPQACGWLGLPRVESTTTHGTGCTFTACVTAAIALGFCAADAAILAKMATTSAVKHGYHAGAGAGVVCIEPDFSWQPDLLPLLRMQRSGLPQLFASLQDEWMGLYPVVDSADWVKRVIDAGAKTVQLRIKSDDARLSVPGFLRNEIERSVAYARAAQVQFYVNDHWELAVACGAYGVHLGQEDLLSADLDTIRQAGLRLGVSTCSLWEMCKAHAVAPSYIACGPVYATNTKEMPWLTQGESNLAYWCKILREPVVAIAGIDEQRSAKVVRCGVKGVAVVSAVTRAANPEQAVGQLQKVIEEARTQPMYYVPLLPHSTYVG